MPTAPKPHRPHGDEPRRQYELFRGTATERGYSKAWSRDSKAELKRRVMTECDPWCRYCGTALATMMDHVVPPSRMGAVGSREYLRWFSDRDNWAPCCVSCNNVKGNSMVGELRGTMKAKVVAMITARVIKQ